MKQKKSISLLSVCKIALLMITVFVSQSKLMAANNKSDIIVSKNGFDDDKKHGKKERSFKNENVVKIVPDVFKKSVHVTARAANEKDLDFLVFDINGNMVANYKLKAGEKGTISDLKRGSYMYHVFADDEYLSSGKIEFR